MKKSLIAMALMAGAVVFVTSCGGGDDPTESTCQNCTVTVTNRSNSQPDKASAVFPNGQYCDANLTAVKAANNQNVAGADATDGKGGKYVVSCQ